MFQYWELRDLGNLRYTDYDVLFWGAGNYYNMFVVVLRKDNKLLLLS